MNKFHVGQKVKIVANEAGHQFKIGDIVELRTIARGGISAWYPKQKRDVHGRGGWWWVSESDIRPIGARVV